MDRPNLIKSLKNDAEKSLYVGCLKFTKLCAMLRLYNLKAKKKWSDKSFTTLLSLLKDIHPKDNKISDRTYDAKKILCFMGLS